MSTSRQAYAWIVGVVLAAPPTAVAQDRSEREVVELIVREGPQAAAIRSATEVVRQEHLARRVPTNPAVSYSREGAGFAEFVEVEQSLGFLATRHALSRAGVAALEGAEAERDARLWRLQSEALARVVTLGAAERRRTVSTDHVRELERLLEIVRVREREGEGSRLDRVRLEHEVRDARLAAADAAAAVADARASVTAMLPAGVTLGPIATPVRAQSANPTLESLLARTVAARSDLQALRSAEDRVRAEGRLARRVRLPSPSVFGGIKRGDEGGSRRTGGVFGVSVAVPVFDTGSRESARWDAERVRIEAERRSLEHQIRTEVAGAFEVWQVRQSALADPDDAGEDLAEMAEVAYREGEVALVELLDAVRAVSRARYRQVDRRLDARLAEIAVERAVGEVVWP